MLYLLFLRTNQVCSCVCCVLLPGEMLPSDVEQAEVSLITSASRTVCQTLSLNHWHFTYELIIFIGVICYLVITRVLSRDFSVHILAVDINSIKLFLELDPIKCYYDGTV